MCKILYNIYTHIIYIFYNVKASKVSAFLSAVQKNSLYLYVHVRSQGGSR